MGKIFPHPLFILKTTPNGSDQSRVGIVTSRAVGSAVQRNRIRRRLRACLEAKVYKILPGNDLVWIAKKGILETGYPALQEAMHSLLKSAGLL